MRGWPQRDEELADAGVATGERDADAAELERIVLDLAAQRGQIGAPEAVAVRITELHDEAGYDPVDQHTDEEVSARELQQALGGKRAFVTPESDRERPYVRREFEPSVVEGAGAPHVLAGNGRAAIPSPS